MNVYDNARYFVDVSILLLRAQDLLSPRYGRVTLEGFIASRRSGRVGEVAREFGKKRILEARGGELGAGAEFVRKVGERRIFRDICCRQK